MSSGISIGMSLQSKLGRHEIFQFMVQLYTEQFTNGEETM
jgi:hypothetical protein